MQAKEALHPPASRIVVLICARSEWSALKTLFPEADIKSSSLGPWFQDRLVGFEPTVLFFHSGWGKVAAAAGCQYLIDTCRPQVLVNLGTCGGIAGQVQVGDILTPQRLVAYDIEERMGCPDAAIEFYSSTPQPHWSPIPCGAKPAVMVSGDRDLNPSSTLEIVERYGAVAADWESGAVSWVAERNNVPVLVLRSVTDMVDEADGEAYGHAELFRERTGKAMGELLGKLPGWLAEALAQLN